MNALSVLVLKRFFFWIENDFSLLWEFCYIWSRSVTFLFDFVGKKTKFVEKDLYISISLTYVRYVLSREGTFSNELSKNKPVTVFSNKIYFCTKWMFCTCGPNFWYCPSYCLNFRLYYKCNWLYEITIFFAQWPCCRKKIIKTANLVTAALYFVSHLPDNERKIVPKRPK